MLTNRISFDRGRLKRRERRKNGNTCGQLEDKTGVQEPRRLTIGETSKPISILGSSIIQSTGKWQYFKIIEANFVQGNELAISFEFPDKHSDSLDSNFTKYQHPDGAKLSGLRITIRNLSTTSEDVKKVSYRVFSCCQLCDQHLKNDRRSENSASYSPASLDPNIIVGGQDFSLYNKPTEIVPSRPNLLKQCGNHNVYICEIRDESGILDENQNQTSLQKITRVIEAEIFKILPASLGSRESPSECKDDDGGSIHLPDKYWPKFSMLLEESWNLGILEDIEIYLIPRAITQLKTPSWPFLTIGLSMVI